MVRFTGLDIMVVLAAQHIQDMIDSECECECPRCCLACRAVKEILDARHVKILRTFERFGIEDNPWQCDTGFDLDVISAAWHDPCPVYETMEGKEDDRATETQQDQDEDGDRPAAGRHHESPGHRDPGTGTQREHQTASVGA